MVGERDLGGGGWIQELNKCNEYYLSELSDETLNKNLHLAYELIKNFI